MKTLLLAGTAVLALATAPAMAADLSSKPYPVKAPVAVVPVFSWTGFYLGANAGYGWGDASGNVAVDGGLYSASYSPDGFFGGGQVGYNFQFENNVVLGVEADIEFGDLNDNFSYLDAGTIDDVGFDVTTGVKVEYFGTVRGRLGYAIDNFLPYVTGGFAWARTKFDSSLLLDEPIDGVSGLSSNASNTSYGWVVGAGLEYAFTPNWTAKVEYLYADLGSDTYSATYLGEVYNTSVDLKIQTVKLGVNYKF